MAPRRLNYDTSFRNIRNKKRAAKNRKKSTPRRSSTLGGYLATGIRTLTAFLPGQKVVRPAVDMVLKAIGLVSAINLLHNNILASTQIIGLSTRKALYYGDLLSNCRNIGLQDIDAMGNPVLALNFLTGRISSVKITIDPTTKSSERSGEWAACLIPLKDSGTKGRFADRFPQFEEIKNMPYAKFGLCSKSLVIDWIPRFPRDGQSATERALSSTDPICYIYLAYSQEARESYANFPPEDFNFRVNIMTKCQLGERMINTAFTSGNNYIKLKCNTETPTTSYIVSFKGKSIAVDNAEYINREDQIDIVIPPSHPEYEWLLNEYTTMMTM